MAATQIPAPLIPKVWAGKVWKEGIKKSFFNKFTAKDGSNIIHVNTDLTKQKGDKVIFGLLMQLTGAGVTGNTRLKDNEEAMTMYDFGVTVDQIRHAVKMFDWDTQKAPYEMWPLIKDALTQWFADWQDNTFISKLTASPTASELLFAGGKTAENQITDNDKLTVSLIGKMKRKAQLHQPKIQPVKIDGGEYFVLLANPLAYRDLKSDPDWKEAHYYAYERGLSNPIFTGSSCIIDDVIIYEYERVSVTTTGATGANVCHNLLLGKQAACYAVARNMFPIKDEGDYGNELGQGVAFWGGIEKSKYNEKDYGVIQVMTGGAND